MFGEQTFEEWALELKTLVLILQQLLLKLLLIIIMIIGVFCFRVVGGWVVFFVCLFVFVCVFFGGGVQIWNARTPSIPSHLANWRSHYLILIIGLAKGQVLQGTTGIFVDFRQVMTQQLD